MQERTLLTTDRGHELAASHAPRWTAPPVKTETGQFTDAPLLGNGDVGVIVAGSIDRLVFFCGKNEFISQEEGRPKAMAQVTIDIPGLAGASHEVEQAIARGEVCGVFRSDRLVVRLEAFVQATDTVHNLLVVRLRCEGEGQETAVVRLLPGRGLPRFSETASAGDVLYRDMRTDQEDRLDGYDTARVRVTARCLDGAGRIEDDALRFELRPGASVSLAVCMMSVFDSADYAEEVLSFAAALKEPELEQLHESHRAWWRDYWSQSFIELENKKVERHYCLSLYLLGSCMRAGEEAPSLYGAWLLQDPAWAGIAPLNYNYEAPYFCTVAVNHAELADNYERRLLDWVPNAEANAREDGFSGIYFEAYPGPLPHGSMFCRSKWKEPDSLGRDCYMNQKSNAAFAAAPMILRYFYTCDRAYADKVYEPFLKKAAAFWVDYLRWDGERYVIDDDFVHEGPNAINPQLNPLTSLGFVRLLFQGVIRISRDLGVDEPMRAVWQERLDNLSGYPTFELNGRTVFRNQEAGTSREFARSGYGMDEEWSEWSSVCAIPEMSLLYPGSQIGLRSEPELLEIARNTVIEQARWQDNNMTCFFYASAARVGHDPEEIVAQLTRLIDEKGQSNGTFTLEGGGIENLNTVPSALTEMMLQSFQGTLHPFPNWPKRQDAAFGRLRAYGNVLVSAAQRQGVVRYVCLEPQSGGSWTVANPWGDRAAKLDRDGRTTNLPPGTEWTIAGAAGERIVLWPE